MHKFSLTILTGFSLAVMAQEPARREVRVQTFEVATPTAGVAGPGGPGTIHFMAAGSGAGKAIQGAPYSAESVTEYVRTLADGTRITRRTNAKFARDSQGRTRDEQNAPGLGPWASREGIKLITIFDPVAKEVYILNEKEKTAQRIKLSGPASVSTSSSSSSGSSTSGSGAVREVRVERRVQVVQGGPVDVAGGLAMPGSDILMRRGEARGEPLGTQTMEGLQVQGTRTTRTVPAGEMGNDRALVSTEERWESTELKTVVRSTSHDPEFGDTSFRLTNINRSEPAKSLFQVPADYKIEDGPQPLRMELGNRP